MGWSGKINTWAWNKQVDIVRANQRKDGTPYLKQHKWRCTFRVAYQVCLLIWPFAHVKLDKIQQIIEYYSDKKIMNGNVLNLEEYKQLMALE